MLVSRPGRHRALQVSAGGGVRAGCGSMLFDAGLFPGGVG
jgi:hypothetical protein